MKRRILATALTLCLTLSLVPTAAFAAGDKTFDDVNGHWGQASVERWAGYGVLNGDDFGNFNPDKQMTRAEFATMLANMMGYTAKANSSFGDVASDAWYADAILKLAAAGVMLGDNNGNANPNKPISRAEAAVMLCRAFNIQPSNSGLNFADSGDVADWAKGSMAALAEKGMMNGVGNNQLAPLANITRASVAKLVDNMVSEYVTESKEITGTVNGIVLVVGSAEVTVKDATLTENLIVAPKAEGAEVTLTGSTTASDVYVDAAASVKVDAQASAGEVQLSAPKAAAEVAGKADTVTTTADAADATVTVAKDATVSKVEVAAPNTGLNVAGKVDNVNVASSATGTEVKTESGATVSNVTTSANDVKVSGNGKVENVTANGGTADVTTPGTKVENKTDSADNVTANGKPVPPSSGGTTTPTTPGGSGGSGSGGGNQPTVSDPTITVAASTGTLLEKNVSDLQGNLSITSNGNTIVVSGESKKIASWPQWGAVTDDYFVALNVALNTNGHSDATMTFASTDNDQKPLASGDDLVWKLTEPNGVRKNIVVTITYDKPADSGEEETPQTEEAKTVTYTIDLSGVTKGTASTVDVVKMDADVFNLYKSATSFKIGIPNELTSFGNPTIATTGTTVKATGSLNYTGWPGFNTYNTGEQFGYYLPIMFEVPRTSANNESEATKNTNVTIQTKNGTRETKSFTADAVDTVGEKDYFSCFFYVDVENGKPAHNASITVDLDGAGTNYGATTYTIDMSGLTLNQSNAALSLALRSINGPATGDLDNFDYGAAYTAWGVSLTSTSNTLNVDLNTVKSKLDEATPNEKDTQSDSDQAEEVTAAQQKAAMTHGTNLYAGIQLSIPENATGLFAVIGNSVVFSGEGNIPAAIPTGTTQKNGFDFFNPGSTGTKCFIDYVPFATTNGEAVTLSSSSIGPSYTYRLAWFTGSAESGWNLLKVETATLTLNTTPVTTPTTPTE